MAKKHGKYSFSFEKKIYINGWGNVAGAKEQQGPLGGLFDSIEQDLYCGKKNMEQAEVHLQQTALTHALRRAGIEKEQIDLVGAGDLLNQCISSAFSFRDTSIPYVGLYGACSTMALSSLLAGLSIEAGVSQRAAALTSSHFGTAERQYRFPLEYGGQRPPSAQHTVTASGAVILSSSPSSVLLEGGAFGAILDAGVKDGNNMGGAMAPAAAQLITQYLKETHTSPKDYEMIFTGDLGAIGAEALLDLCQEQGADLQSRYQDCGLLVYDRKEQDMHAGGSGCGCSALVLTSLVLPKIAKGEWRNILFISTGALMSPVSLMQGESIPAIAHLIHLKGVQK